MAFDYVTRYVITHKGRKGFRRMTDPKQGRYTYATPEDAQERLDAIQSNGNEWRLVEACGPQSEGTFEVRPCRCFPGHFDPCQEVF